MKGQVALVREQGQTFAVVVVQDRVIRDPQLRDDVLAFAAQQFGARAALIGERSRETYGPNDIVRWLSSVYLEQLPWREFWMNN